MKRRRRVMIVNKFITIPSKQNSGKRIITQINLKERIDMQTSYRISAVNLTTSDNPKYYHIYQVFCHWQDPLTLLPVNGWMDRQYVAEQILNRQATAHVTVGSQTVPVRTQHGKDGVIWLRTRPDDTTEDNLLSLTKYVNGLPISN